MGFSRLDAGTTDPFSRVRLRRDTPRCLSLAGTRTGSEAKQGVHIERPEKPQPAIAWIQGKTIETYRMVPLGTSTVSDDASPGGPSSDCSCVEASRRNLFSRRNLRFSRSSASNRARSSLVSPA